MKNLSFIHEAYEEGDTLVVKEYYLNVDLNNKDLCNLYLNPEYCEKKNVNEPIVVPDEVIINNGVLYQHVFKKIDDKYYYLQSFILSERQVFLSFFFYGKIIMYIRGDIYV